MSIRKATSGDEPRIKAYIGDGYEHCLYLYLNLLQYGCDSDEITVWVQEKQKITAVLLRYHTCIHIFSREHDFDSAELASFLKAQPSLSLVQGESGTIKEVAQFCGESDFTVEYGSIMHCPQGNSPCPSSLDFAAASTLSDLEQVASLYYADELGKTYRYDDLLLQMRTRLESGYGRTFLLRDAGKVIGSISTWAENDSMAVESGLIVAPAHRNKGVAVSLIYFLQSQLMGKRLYAICYTEKALRLHKRAGFVRICDYAKLTSARGGAKV